VRRQDRDRVGPRLCRAAVGGERRGGARVQRGFGGRLQALRQARVQEQPRLHLRGQRGRGRRRRVRHRAGHAHEERRAPRARLERRRRGQ
jgi:hypothetical protein